MSAPDPDGLDLTAALAGRYAAALRDLAGDLSAAVAACPWDGTAARAFHGEVAFLARIQGQGATELVQAADALRRYADQVRLAIARAKQAGGWGIS